MTPRCSTSFSVRAFRSRRRHLHHLQRIGNIVEGAHPRKQRLAVVLEHVAELDLRQQHAVEQDLAFVDRNEPGDHVDQRALAAAVRPEHGDQFAARNIEIEVVVDDRLVEPLGQAANRHMRTLAGAASGEGGDTPVVQGEGRAARSCDGTRCKIRTT